MALREDEDRLIFEQIPDETANLLIMSYLWDEFLFRFKNYFKLQKKLSFFGGNQNRSSDYTWADEKYRMFMCNIIYNLEPFEYHKKEHILEEFDDVNSILFVDSGKIIIGYDINRTKKYCLQFTDKCVIGAYEITFNKKSNFVYTALTYVFGYFIRKANWYDALEIDTNIRNVMKKNILLEFITKIRSKVSVNKKKAF